MSKKRRGLARYRSLAVEEWPEQDRAAWNSAQVPCELDLLVASNPAAKWADSSKDLHTRCYGAWLRWLDGKGLLHAGSAPAERITPTRVWEFLRSRRALGVGPRTVENYAVSLRHMFGALDPEYDWKWMLPVIAKLKEAVAPRPPRPLPTIKELFDYGMHLIRRAESGEDLSTNQRALLFRNGLAIAMLAARPFMRRTNLGTIVIGKNLLREGQRFRLRFTAREMKAKRPAEASLPAVFTPLIEHYIRLHREHLLTKGSGEADALWVSSMGAAIDPKALANEISDTVSSHFGTRVNLHDFRRATGTSLAVFDPKHVGIVTALLGHANYRTSERFYIQATEHHAYRRYAAVLDQLRHGELGVGEPSA